MNASTENLKPPIKEYRARDSVVGIFIKANTTKPKKELKIYYAHEKQNRHF